MLFEKILVAPATKIANRIADVDLLCKVVAAFFFTCTRYINANAIIIVDVATRKVHTVPAGESKISDRTVDRYWSLPPAVSRLLACKNTNAVPLMAIDSAPAIKMRTNLFFANNVKSNEN